MLTYKTGDLLLDDAQALVNAVNCVGIMGAGVAAQFRARWPGYFHDYQQICAAEALKPGKVALHMMPDAPGRYIVSFPTKDHWKNSSSLTGIYRGLSSLAGFLREHNIGSVAMPALGCGLGGLEWEDVKTLLETFAQGNPSLDIRVYKPGFGDRPLLMPR